MSSTIIIGTIHIHSNQDSLSLGYINIETCNSPESEWKLLFGTVSVMLLQKTKGKLRFLSSLKLHATLTHLFSLKQFIYCVFLLSYPAM